MSNIPDSNILPARTFHELSVLSPELAAKTE